MSGFDLLHALDALKKNPRSEQGRLKLDGAVYNYPHGSFAAGFPSRHKDLARMIHYSAQQVLNHWDEENARWQWIRVACQLKRILEKPKKLPKPRKQKVEEIDLKKRAAGDD